MMEKMSIFVPFNTYILNTYANNNGNWYHSIAQTFSFNLIYIMSILADE